MFRVRYDCDPYIVAALIANSVAIMPKCSKADAAGGSVTRAQHARCKHHVDICRNEQKRCMQRTVFNSWTGESFIAQYDELTKLSLQLSATLRISSSLQSKRKNTKCNGVVADKTKKHAASTSSEAMQDNTTHPAQLASTSRVFRNRKLEAKNMKHSTAQKCKNTLKENKKSNRTMIVSANGRCRIKNSVANQVEHI